MPLARNSSVQFKPSSRTSLSRRRRGTLPRAHVIREPPSTLEDDAQNDHDEIDMAGEPLEDDGFSEDYDDRMGTFYEPKIDREHHNFRGAYVRRRRRPMPLRKFDDANHGVSATRRRSYRGGDGQYVEYNSDEYRDQFSKDEDDRDGQG